MLPLPLISVIIPCFNYQAYITEAIESVKTQTLNNLECIIVDDGSTDNSVEIIREAIKNDLRFKLLQKTNGGVATTRNYGIERAQAPYIACLDADDIIGHPECLERLVRALENDPTLGIAFTGLAMFREMNRQREFRRGTWPDGFSYDEQAAGHNQVPTFCAFRRDAWKRAGGYRSLNEPAEDAELFLRITTIGYGAMQVTKEPWFYYRWHEQSLSHPVRSQQIHEPNWRRWFANTQGLQRPLAAGGNPPRRSWPVRNYDRPLVTFIVPVGAGHERYLKDALDSIEGQTDRRWACIVVNDTGQPLTLPGHPWSKVINTTERKGPGHARNVGLQAATSPLIAFLDADDLLEAKFLELCLTAYSISGRYIYTDWMTLNGQGHIGKHETPEYEAGIVFQQTSIHAISILIERQHLLKVGGFDETMTAWEDVDLFMRLAAAGICGQRVAKPLLYYRHETGTVRERGETVKAELKALLFERYKPYMLGDVMCDCGNKPKAKLVNGNGNGATASAQSAASGEMARVLYQGPKARHDVYGGSTRQYYGRRAGGDVFLVWERDQVTAPLTFVPIAAIEDIIEPTPMPPEPELV